MSDSKVCPYCGEQIKSIAIKCKHCHTMLDGAPPTIPKEVGAYKILSIIGKGGMGTVYRGRHRTESMARRQGGDVCIKTMHGHFADDPAFKARFEREASLGLELDHSGIVKVHDLVIDAGTLALVMEHVVGRTMEDMINDETGPIPWDRAWPMFSQLLEAMEHAHEHDVIHRDLKPENVMVTAEGRLKILDFGIAKEVGSGETKTGIGFGTPDYMAPEQHTDAKNVDERADVYSLGMTLYKMLAKRLPWGEELDLTGIFSCKQSTDLPPPTEFYPDIPPEVVRVVMSTLSPDREKRPGTVKALRELLEKVKMRPANFPATVKPAPEPVARPDDVVPVHPPMDQPANELPPAEESQDDPREVEQPAQAHSRGEPRPDPDLPQPEAAQPSTSSTAMVTEPPGRGRTPWMVGALVAALVLGGAIYIITSNGPEPSALTAGATEAVSKQLSIAPVAPARQQQKKVASLEGELQIVWTYSKAARLEFSRSEVTLGQFRACVNAGKCTRDTFATAPKNEHCNWGKEGRDRHPMNCVDRHGADAFCRWAGGRLPRSKEWFAEASAGDSRVYPWGEKKAACVNVVMGHERGCTAADPCGCKKNGTWPVCSKPAGNSVSGLCDMSGNVREWTSSQDGSANALRGGGWDQCYQADLRASARFSANSNLMDRSGGFRCVKSR